MNCPDVMTLATLDEIAECWDGVDKATISELYDQLLPDPRDAADGWDPASWNECSPNNVKEAWIRLPKELQSKLVKIAELNSI